MTVFHRYDEESSSHSKSSSWMYTCRSIITWVDMWYNIPVWKMILHGWKWSKKWYELQQKRKPTHLAKVHQSKQKLPFQPYPVLQQTDLIPYLRIFINAQKRQRYNSYSKENWLKITPIPPRLLPQARTVIPKSASEMLNTIPTVWCGEIKCFKRKK